MTTTFVRTLDPSTLGNEKDGTHSEPCHLKGCALEVRIRTNHDGTRSMQGRFRYPGSKFGEPRTARVELGDLGLGLDELRRRAQDCEHLIAEGKSPKRHFEEQLKKRLAANMTFGEAFDIFWNYAVAHLWNAKTTDNNTTTRKKHIEPMAIMKMPLDSIRSKHLEDAFGLQWRTMSGIGPRLRSLIHSTFQFQIDDEDSPFKGPNPCGWSEKTSLSKKLGPQLPTSPFPGVHYEDLPKLMKYFHEPMDHWVPGYLTVMQAAYAFDRDPKSIREACAKGRFPGSIKAPPIWKSSSNLIPIEELHERYGRFQREPKPLEHESARLHSQLMKFLIFTPVRSANGSELRFRNIKEDKGIIEYLPKRKDPVTKKVLPSEHKLGWQVPVPYIVILTPNLRAIIDERRQQQIDDDIPIERDGYVFVHGRSRTGDDDWWGHHSSHRTLDDYITKGIARLEAKGEYIRVVPEGAEKATIHGLRAAFTTWAKENFSDNQIDDLINLSLGHTIPAIRQNPTNWSYFYGVEMLEKRRQLMNAWEKHCLSLVEVKVEPQQNNVVALRSAT
jgi:integrase